MSSPRTLDELYRWAKDAPPGTLIPADSLAAMLSGVEDGDDRLADLTVEEAAKQLNRAPSTVRGWLGSGELRGYRVNGREWRVPRPAVREYLEGQKSGNRQAVKTNGKAADLGQWRTAIAGDGR